MWMDNDSKAEAIKKVKKISENIAYPTWTMNNETLRDYYEVV